MIANNFKKAKILAKKDLKQLTILKKKNHAKKIETLILSRCKS